jgi:riboflavin biosynthesis pyrimidine reductase
VHVLSSTLPADADPRITVHADLDAAVAALHAAGYPRVYVDGGAACARRSPWSPTPSR